MKITCYECQNVGICKFYSDVDRAIKHNTGMLDVDEPSSSDCSFTAIIAALAHACKFFNKLP